MFRLDQPMPQMGQCFSSFGVGPNETNVGTGGMAEPTRTTGRLSGNPDLLLRFNIDKKWKLWKTPEHHTTSNTSKT